MDFEITTCRYEDLTEQDWLDFLHVTKEAFKEHKDQGLNMYPCSVNLERLKRFLSDCHFFVVRSAGRIVAFRGAKLLREGGSLYMAGQLVAVSLACRGMGVGKKLFRAFEDYAMEAGCAFIQTDTSCEAKSSKAYHHSCGFEDWSFASWENTNYYTIIMRKLLPPGRKYSPWVRYSSLIKSYVYCHLRYDKNGKERLGFRVAKFPYTCMKKVFKMFS